jgi:hypothetical protein
MIHWNNWSVACFELEQIIMESFDYLEYCEESTPSGLVIDFELSSKEQFMSGTSMKVSVFRCKVTRMVQWKLVEIPD